MKFSHSISKSVLVVLVITIFSGCAAHRHAFISPNFNQHPISTFAILPVIDHTATLAIKGKKIDSERLIIIPIQKSLKKKGYNTILLSTFKKGSSIGNEEVVDMEDTDLVSLIPEEADAVVAVYLNDYRAEGGMRFLRPIFDSVVEFSGRAIGRDVVLLWNDTLRYEERASGIVPVAFESASPCCKGIPKQLFKTFPKKISKQ